MKTQLFLLKILTFMILQTNSFASTKNLDDILKDIQNIEKRYLIPVLYERANKITANMSNGQLLFLMKDYERSAIVLLDAIETKSSRLNPSYSDSLYYLSESLFQIKNYNASAQFFQKILDEPKNNHKEKAITRLLEISLITKNAKIAQDYLKKAQTTIINADKNNQLLYAIGKYYYRTGDLNQATSSFNKIDQNSEFGLRAQYFLGVIYIRNNKLDDAINLFQKILNHKNIFDEERFVIEETKLALARIFYEKNSLDQATNLYAMILRDSNIFEQGLYESVWISIKQQNFEKALRKLEVQIISQPNVIKGPDARLLQGKLFMMIKDYNQATESFQEVLFEFSSIQNEMNLLIKNANGDLSSYFNKVIGKNIEDFDLISFLPNKAAEFAGKDIEADKALVIINNLASQKRDIDEASRTINKIEIALNSENRIKIFPKLYEGSIKAIEVKSNLINYLEDISDDIFNKRNINDPEYLSLRNNRLNIGNIYKNTPQSSSDFIKREKIVNNKLLEIDQDAFKIGLEIRSVEAQLTAIRKYINDISKQQTVMIEKNKKIRDNTIKEMEYLLKLKSELIQLSEAIETEKIKTGIKDNASSYDLNTKNNYFNLLLKEVTWLGEQSYLSNGPMIVNQVKQINEKSNEIDNKISILVDEGIIDIKNSLKSEKEKISLYKNELNGFKLKTEMLGGAIAAKNFNYVKKLIDQIILEADVGLIDIAWKEKEDQTTQITRILSKQRDELESLELNMKEINDE
ncbi:hypothetical protein KKB55_16595 [Myxococcota bacterium]|nr:hypothetical protein [Myxococcota bacterium]